MSIAVTGAILLGQWPEAAMVMVLFTVAELIEAKSLDRARNAIKGLMQLTPELATVLQSDGAWLEVAAKTVLVDARVRVKPGERIALDGKIVSGKSAINQAPITGESLPVEKAEGDPVFAGTINESGSFEYLVTACAYPSANCASSACGKSSPRHSVARSVKLWVPFSSSSRTSSRSRRHRRAETSASFRGLSGGIGLQLRKSVRRVTSV